LRDDDKAEAAFTKVLEKDPTYSLAHSYIGKLWAEKENYLKAQESIEKAIAIDPDYFDYWIDYGLYLRFRGKKTEAINAWSKAIELRSDYFLSYAYRASLYDELEEYEKSLEDYKMIVKLNPKYYYAYENMGMLYFKKGLWQASILCFEKALEYNPESFSYKMMIAANYVRTNERVKSRKFFETNLRVLDKAGVEYAVMRMYMDLITQGVEQKIRKEESVTKRGKFLFYYGLLQDLKGNDVMAKKYYTEVHELQAPMFFEYQINDWILEGKHAPLCDKKE
jgi:tetratricopeptide (TPR) repeat protein